MLTLDSNVNTFFLNLQHNVIQSFKIDW